MSRKKQILEMSYETFEDILKTGVYSIVSKIDGKFYVGSAANFSKGGFYSRWSVHLVNLENNKHHNKHLQAAWNKYGRENFSFKILEFCEPKETIELEQIYIDLSKHDLLYNFCLTAGSFLGMKHDPKTLTGRRNPNIVNYSVISPEGILYEGENLKDFARSKNISPTNLHHVISGRYVHSEGWTSSFENHNKYKKYYELRGITKYYKKYIVRLPAKIAKSEKRIVLGYYSNLEEAKFSRDLAEVIWNFKYKIQRKK